MTLSLFDIIIIMTLLTLINVATTVAGVCLLHTFIKLYSEVLKIGHIKNIGKS